MKKQWRVEVDGVIHEVVYETKFTKKKLTVDGAEKTLPNEWKQQYFGSDIPVNVGGKECRLVIVPGWTKPMVDLAVDGVFAESGKVYTPMGKMPGWTWIFIVLCALPIFIGGAIPVAAALVGAMNCGITGKSNRPTGQKLLLCIGTTVGCWLVVFVAIVVVSMLLA